MIYMFVYCISWIVYTMLIAGICALIGLPWWINSFVGAMIGLYFAFQTTRLVDNIIDKFPNYEVIFSITIVIVILSLSILWYMLTMPSNFQYFR